MTFEASVILPQFKVLFTIEERKAAYNRLKDYGYEIHGIVFDDISTKNSAKTYFKVIHYYSRKDVYKIIEVPNAQQGGIGIQAIRALTTILSCLLI